MELDEFLHPRVIAVAATKLQDGHFQDAAFAAVREVEEALREALGDSSAFGRKAVQKIVSSNGVSLGFPYSRMRTKERDVHTYFDALFGYHRNALAHENVELSRAECIRILAAASELMAMLGASVRS